MTQIILMTKAASGFSRACTKLYAKKGRLPIPLSFRLSPPAFRLLSAGF